jgi:hypothetical protein
MLGYAPGAWTAFFSAMIAAAAALTGLLFVAVSINLAGILKASKLRSAFLLARAGFSWPGPPKPWPRCCLS